MRGLMMDYPLSIPAILRRAGTLFGNRPVVGRRNDRAVARATYADVIDRVQRLAVALRALGVGSGDRVATLRGTATRISKRIWPCPRSAPSSIR